ncbi:hypothetical protein SHAM105786_04940 [Shewanella amazonensis]
MTIKEGANWLPLLYRPNCGSPIHQDFLTQSPVSVLVWLLGEHQLSILTVYPNGFTGDKFTPQQFLRQRIFNLLL